MMIVTKFLRISAILTFALVPFLGFSNDAEHAHVEAEPKDTKTEIKEFINHHLQDNHDFHITSWKGTHYGFPLPVILYDNGLHVFMSSKFHHGETVAESNGNYYKIYHDKIYKIDAEVTLSYDQNHIVINDIPLDFSFTKNVMMIIVIVILILLMFSSLARTYAKNRGMPKRISLFFAPITLSIRYDIAI